MVLPAVLVIGVALAVDPLPSTPEPWLLYPVLWIIGWLGDEYRVRTRQDAFHSLTAAIHPPLIFLLTPVEAICLSTLSLVCAQVRRKLSPHIVLCNAILRTLGIGVPALVLAFLRSSVGNLDTHRVLFNADNLKLLLGSSTGTLVVGSISTLYSVEIMALIVIVLALYFLVDGLVTAAFLSKLTTTSLRTALWDYVRAAPLPETTKCITGVIAALVYVINPVFALCAILPVIMAHAMTSRIFRMESQTIEAVTAMADAIDYRDPYTAQHSVRVAEMVNRLARRLNLSSQDVDEMTLAARVHDLGKIGIANEILLKDGKLTAEEMAVMRAHPEIGVSILQKYDSFEATLPMVMHHHERYDGRGYPRGISGNEIPMGARLIAVVDAYDAMTSDRPYRKGMRPLIAVQRIAEATGTQFDPAVAATFVAMMYEELAAKGEHVPNIGGSLGYEPELIAAGAEDKVRYLFPTNKP